MKKFKTKKHINKKLIFIILLILITLLLKKIKILKIIKLNPVQTLESSSIYKIKEHKTKNPTIILSQMIPYHTPNKEKNFYLIKTESPQIYIYNTHQQEEYIGEATVLTAAYYLKDNLEKQGIKTIVEETNIKEILENNNWNYDQSYKASRINLEKIKEQYPSIKIFIDLHRDALPKNLSTVTINNKDYAKVLFVIGKEHDNYLKNLEFTKSINNIIEKDYPTLTKGILEKEGPGVNGIYNQDLGENIILMEVGAEENNLEEVINTLDVITNVIKEKLNEKK